MSAVMPRTHLDTALDIGMGLCRDAIWSGSECNWLGDAMEPLLGEWRAVHRAFAPDLYSGTSGIALFLARLARYDEEPILRTTARGAIRQAFQRREDILPNARHSLYSGWLGIAWSMLEVAELHGDRALADDALRMIEATRGREVPDMSLDIIGGVAGTITALVAFYRRSGRASFIDEASRLAQVLRARANRDGDALSWTTMPSLTPAPQRDLTGYSHGTAGIALALFELHAVTGDEMLRDTAERAIAYERKCFDAKAQNWPDFRNMPSASAPPEQYGCGMAWCHGAPGIGLARLRAYQLTGDASYRREAEIALNTTLAAVTHPAQYDNFSLCHGLAGNAELFLDAANVLRDPRHRAVAENIARMGSEGIAASHAPWPCGVNGGGETPGLMLGLAGIGWFYLRMHDLAVPSLLMLI